MVAVVKRRPVMPQRIVRLNRRRIFTGSRELRGHVVEWAALAACVAALALLGWWRA